MSGSGPFLGTVAGACARHPLVVVLLWLTITSAALLGGTAAGAGFVDDFQLPGSQAADGLELLAEVEPDQDWASSQIVIHDPDGSVTDHRTTVEQAQVDLAGSPEIARITGPFAVGSVSPDDTTTTLTVTLNISADELTASQLGNIEQALQPVRDVGLQVEYSGQLGKRFDEAGASEHTRAAEAVGLMAALGVLLFFFRSLLGAVVPIVCSVVAVALGAGLLLLATSAFDFPTASPALAMMIGLGTGIDYGLLLTTRFRQLVSGGMSHRLAAEHAASTSGHAVLVGGTTVALALMALFASGVPFVGKLGVAAVLTVLTSMLAALTLVPAAFGVVGRVIDKVSLGRPRAEPDEETERRIGWNRYARLVARRPLPWLLGALSVVAMLTAPAFALDIGPIDDGADPTTHTSRRAHDLLAEEYGAGVNGVLTIALDASQLPVEDARTWADDVAGSLRKDDAVATVGEPAPVGDSEVWRMSVTPRSSPQSQETADLVARIDDTLLPESWRNEWGAEAPSFVTGQTAAHIEFGGMLANRLPLIISLVVLASLMVLTLSFRSPVVAVKAAILNILSIGAAYGVLVAVFQWQWGSALVGLDTAVPVESYVPMLMFVIVFGLSMDYEVFLLSRVREIWLRTGDDLTAVSEGLAATGRVITAAALIMICVFLGFTGYDDVAVKMLAVGLAVSVAVDATLVRLVLVPSAMALMGRRNWWEPRWLARLAGGRPRSSSSTVDITGQ